MVGQEGLKNTFESYLKGTDGTKMWKSCLGELVE
jgi:hypothetical protein